MLCKRPPRLPVTTTSRSCTASMVVLTPSYGDLNNTSAVRPHTSIQTDMKYPCPSLAIMEKDDDPQIRSTYRPFLLDKKTNVGDWIEDLELATVTKIAAEDAARTGERLKVLVLFGSLRQRFVDRAPLHACFWVCVRLISKMCSQVIFTPDGF